MKGRLQPLVVSLSLLLAAQPVATAWAEEPVLRRAEPDPERRGRLVVWWQRWVRVEPTIASATRQLRWERRWWRGRVTKAGCRRVGRSLDAIDRRALLRGADYSLALTVDRALAALDRASSACLERRYFELDYHLRLAESALARIENLVRAELARSPSP